MPDVYVRARSANWPEGDPVPGVLVQLYAEDGLVASAYTDDESGLAFLGNRGAGEYEARVCPGAGAAIPTWRLGLSVGGNSDNVFDVAIIGEELPLSANPACCRCTGYFADSSMRYLPGLTIEFTEYASLPKLVEGVYDNPVIIVPLPISARIKNDGSVSVDLLRGAKYAVRAPGMISADRIIEVPDLPAAPLGYVLHAVVKRVEWLLDSVALNPLDEPELALAVDQEVDLQVVTVYKSGMRKCGLVDVNLNIPDDGVVSITETGAGGYRVVGLTAGSTVIQVHEKEPTYQESTVHGSEPGADVSGFLYITVT